MPPRRYSIFATAHISTSSWKNDSPVIDVECSFSEFTCSHFPWIRVTVNSAISWLNEYSFSLEFWFKIRLDLHSSLQMDFVFQSIHVQPCMWEAETVQEECSVNLGMDPVLILPTVWLIVILIPMLAVHWVIIECWVKHSLTLSFLAKEVDEDIAGFLSSLCCY